MNSIVPANMWTPIDIPELDPAADEAVRSDTNIVVVAGPGAGKTKMLAQRACYLLQTGLCPNPYRILAISFKRDAARNLKERVARRAGSDYSARFDSFTFDAFSKSLLDRFRKGLPPDWRPTPDYRINFKIDEGYVAEILSSSRYRALRADPRDIYRNYFTAGLLFLESQPENLAAKVSVDLWGYLLKEGEESELSFPMIGCLSELILTCNPKIKEALRTTYRYVFLDEFQDTTGVQYRLLNTAFKGSMSVITAVGDNKQQIMQWAGSVDQSFVRAQQDHGARLVRLACNYRSSKELVQIQQVFANALDPETPAVEARGKTLIREDVCKVLQFRDHRDETEYIAKIIKQWIDEGIEPREICVLTRNRPDDYSARLREKLNHFGVRCRVETELQDLLSEDLTRIIVHFLRLCVSKRNSESWVAIMDLLMQICGDESDARVRVEEGRLAQCIREIAGNLRVMPGDVNAIRGVLEGIVEVLGYAPLAVLFPQYRDRNFYNEQLGKISKYLAEFHRGRDWRQTLDEFEGNDSVPVMTLHKSKGLEYHTVVFIGLEDSAFFNYKDKPFEEGCGFFVALSRAKQRVVFTFSSVRPNKYGTLKPQKRDELYPIYSLLEEAGVPLDVIEGAENGMRYV